MAHQLVRRYRSDDPIPVADPAKLRVAPEWFNTPSALSAAPGMHRFVWPLRYPLVAALDESRRGAFADGVWAPPGEYKVVLTASGQRLTRSLTIAPDLRVTLAPSAYAEQFALARQIEETRAPVHAALADAEELFKKLDECTDAASEATKARAREISEFVTFDFWWVSPRRTDSLRFLDSALSRLEEAVDGADAAPTPDAREGFARQRPAAEAAVRRWNELKATIK